MSVHVYVQRLIGVKSRCFKIKCCCIHIYCRPFKGPYYCQHYSSAVLKHHNHLIVFEHPKHTFDYHLLNVCLTCVPLSIL